MSKRLNYYQVHKNKTPKRLNYISTDKVAKCIAMATKIVRNAIELFQKQIEKSQPIPKYQLGSVSNENKLALVGENKNEVVVDKNGIFHELSEAQDFIEAGKYLESLSPNLEEASIALNNFGKQINS